MKPLTVLRRFRTLLLAALAVMLLGIPPVTALPDGPDAPGPASFFQILVKEIGDDPLLNYDILTFDRTVGWDFGDRPGYGCAWVEYFVGADEKFEVHFEWIGDYSPGVKIVDKHGSEDANDDNVRALCHSVIPSQQLNQRLRFDGTDHFPHHTELAFYSSGEPLISLDLTNDECARGYWVPGDDPGEAWLWWDADGPQNDGHHELDCGGGPGEPQATLRAYVTNADPDIGYCVGDDLDGDLCYNVDVNVSP